MECSHKSRVCLCVCLAVGIRISSAVVNMSEDGETIFFFPPVDIIDGENAERAPWAKEKKGDASWWFIEGPLIIKHTQAQLEEH